MYLACQTKFWMYTWWIMGKKFVWKYMLGGCVLCTLGIRKRPCFGGVSRDFCWRLHIFNHIAFAFAWLWCWRINRERKRAWGIEMSYLLPHLHSGWAVDQAILSEEQRVVVIRFGHDWDDTCMQVLSLSLSITSLQSLPIQQSSFTSNM